MQKLRKDDQVIVIAGRDKGKTGTVTRILDNARLYVSGINMIKKHTRGNPQKGRPGGIIEKEATLHVSNVAIFNTGTGKADRIGIETLDNGDKVRIFKSSGEQIDG